VQANYRPQGADRYEGHAITLINAIDGLAIESLPGAVHGGQMLQR
jgi:hypothetical protein